MLQGGYRCSTRGQKLGANRRLISLPAFVPVRVLAVLTSVDPNLNHIISLEVRVFSLFPFNPHQNKPGFGLGFLYQQDGSWEESTRFPD